MGKIMVVDDAPEVTQLIAGILTEVGHEVVPLNSAEALEDRIAESAPDLLLLDIVMPNRDGYQALRGLRRNAATKELPVVLVSTKSEPSDVEWGTFQGASAYLPKPFTSEELLAVVRPYVG